MVSEFLPHQKSRKKCFWRWFRKDIKIAWIYNFHKLYYTVAFLWDRLPEPTQGPTLGSQLESILAIKLLENSLLNQMNMALVENVNVLETCIEAVSSKSWNVSGNLMKKYSSTVNFYFRWSNWTFNVRIGCENRNMQRNTFSIRTAIRICNSSTSSGSKKWIKKVWN